MRTKLNIIIFMIIAGLLASCQSVEKMMDNGNYDQLIQLAQRKLSGKKEKKEKYVRALEDGFERAKERDMRRIELLKHSDDPDDWEKIIAIAERIERRQDRLQPFLPLIDRQGYKATFEFVKTHEITAYAEGQIVARLYDEGMYALERGRSGDKPAAQDAYLSFNRILKYTDRYRDVAVLRDEARQLGIVHVVIAIENQAREWMPGYIAAALTEPFYIEDRFWTRYTFAGDEGDYDADYEALLVVTDVSVGHASIHEEEIVRKREIEDGFTYVLDAQGNVAKDSLGNDIKEPKFVKVQGVVVRTHQEKLAHIRGRIKVRDLRQNMVVDTRPIHAEARFYHVGQTHYGDARALDKDDKRYIGLLPFPSDEELILEASEALKPIFMEEVERNRYI
ncbi:MAG: hypothetical protein R3301_00575 [Saprospiraceae bacterium]|nr:hypothetical protein [Saprospiraceae bacterium]